jgi:two-component system LytT family response regulator
MTDNIGTRRTAERYPPDSRLLSVGVGAAVWVFVTLASAAQGQFFAAYHGRPQLWWPTLGYTAAVFSVWALLAPVILRAAHRIYAARLPRVTATALWILGYPIATALHVAIFVALFWPVYGSSAATPLAMVKPVLLANLDKSAFAYVALIAVTHLRHRLRERAKAERPADPAPADDEGLWIRIAGGSHLVRFEEIDWIAAAGDYAEVHAAGRSLLTDRSLTALAEQLPQKDFARIHRGAIVRLDRVREVRRLGRGDASIFLDTGRALRLSRRYRENLATRLPF